jgi:histidinol-phosphate phosphatase family protein
MIKTVFIDRDGVVNVNIPRGYVTRPEELQILPGVAKAIKKLNDAGISVILISNQQGVAKGLMTRDMLQIIDDEMRKRLADEESASIVKSYYCVHLSTDDCECRKPKGGQLIRAANELSVNLSESVFIGDTPTDIQAGKSAGVGHCALVMSGATKTYVPGQWPHAPDTVHRDLLTAVDWIFSTNNN